MTATAQLAMPLLDQAQAQPHLTINESLGVADAAIAGRLAIDASAGGTIALTAAQALYAQINVYGTPASAFTVTIPARAGEWIVVNDTAQDCTFKPASGVGQVVPGGSSSHLLCDTTNIVAASSAWSQNVTIADGKHLIVGTSAGTKIGTAAAQKIGLFGATPVPQPASANQAVVSQTAGGTYSSTEQAMLGDLKRLVNELRAALVALGAIKGSA